MNSIFVGLAIAEDRFLVDSPNFLRVDRMKFSAPVAQWIEQRFPKPLVACSIHAGGVFPDRFINNYSYLRFSSPQRALENHEIYARGANSLSVAFCGHPIYL